MSDSQEPRLTQLAQQMALPFADGLPIEVAASVIIGCLRHLLTPFGIGDQGRDSGGKGFRRFGFPDAVAMQ